MLVFVALISFPVFAQLTHLHQRLYTQQFQDVDTIFWTRSARRITLVCLAMFSAITIAYLAVSIGQDGEACVAARNAGMEMPLHPALASWILQVLLWMLGLLIPISCSLVIGVRFSYSRFVPLFAARWNKLWYGAFCGLLVVTAFLMVSFVVEHQATRLLVRLCAFEGYTVYLVFVFFGKGVNRELLGRREFYKVALEANRKLTTSEDEAARHRMWFDDQYEREDTMLGARINNLQWELEKQKERRSKLERLKADFDWRLLSQEVASKRPLLSTDKVDVYVMRGADGAAPGTETIEKITQRGLAEFHASEGKVSLYEARARRSVTGRNRATKMRASGARRSMLGLGGTELAASGPRAGEGGGGAAPDQIGRARGDSSARRARPPEAGPLQPPRV